MSTLPLVYRQNLALLTDLYQLTMAYGYWRNGLAEREAVFQLTFRKAPFGGQYAVACGLAYAFELLHGFHFEADDLDYLASLRGAGEEPLFDRPFLDFLSRAKLTCDLDAVPEGTVIFANEPLIRVKGPLWQAQLLETALLNLINFQTLIATKASRVVKAAAGDQVLEFGLRRAQGIDGGITASRAAFIGGCHATSNVLAGKLFGIPVRGTHAHSWVMAYGDELAAFRGYCGAMPQNCVLLVDTYDTAEGLAHAAEVGKELQRQGKQLQGVRLDSGDLLALSQQGRTILDAAKQTGTAIVASSELDEHEIARLKAAGAPISVWGVGTKLATAYDQPALGGVYKLTAIADERGAWHDRLKLSDQPVKISDPGILQVRRYRHQGRFQGDVIYDERLGVMPPEHFVGQATGLSADAAAEDLLVPVFRAGQSVYEVPSPQDARQRTVQLSQFDETITRLDRPLPYPVVMDRQVIRRKAELIAEARRNHR